MRYLVVAGLFFVGLLVNLAVETKINADAKVIASYDFDNSNFVTLEGGKKYKIRVINEMDDSDPSLLTTPNVIVKLDSYNKIHTYSFNKGGSVASSRKRRVSTYVNLYKSFSVEDGIYAWEVNVRRHSDYNGIKAELVEDPSGFPHKYLSVIFIFLVLSALFKARGKSNN